MTPEFPKPITIKVYTAILNQSGTSNPVLTTLHNTIGVITWTRSSAGIYIGTLTTPIVGLCALFATKSEQTKLITFAQLDATQVEIRQTNSSFTLVDNITNLPIEIRTYNNL